VAGGYREPFCGSRIIREEDGSASELDSGSSGEGKVGAVVNTVMNSSSSVKCAEFLDYLRSC
jgi:hypothetical protein